ncbi:MAG: hypothetical protein KGO02_15355 [Alphaproteobacteria bacterium]|nr:hypothetical protein [Alphaproteobacteria bacterium]
MNESQANQGAQNANSGTMRFLKKHWVVTWFGVGLTSYAVLATASYWLMMHGFAIAEHGSYDRAVSVATIIQATFAAAGLLAVSAALLAIARNTDHTYKEQLEQQVWQRREEFTQFAEDVLRKGLETYSQIAYTISLQIGINVINFDKLNGQDEEQVWKAYCEHIRMQDWDEVFKIQIERLYTDLHARAIAHSPFWKGMPSMQETLETFINSDDHQNLLNTYKEKYGSKYEMKKHELEEIEKDVLKGEQTDKAWAAWATYEKIVKSKIDKNLPSVYQSQGGTVDLRVDSESVAVPLNALTACQAFVKVAGKKFEACASDLHRNPLAPWLHSSYCPRYERDTHDFKTAPFTALLAVVDLIPSLFNIVAYLEQYHMADTHNNKGFLEQQERFRQYLHIPSINPLCVIHKIRNADDLRGYLAKEASSGSQFGNGGALSEERMRELQYWFGDYAIFFSKIYNIILTRRTPFAFNEWKDRIFAYRYGMPTK